MKSRSSAILIALFVVGLTSFRAGAVPLTFTIDQSQSRLFITGDFDGSPFTPQGSGSLTTSYTGTIEVDLTDGVLTFVPGSLIAAANNGTWAPGLNGASGSAGANYGGHVSSFDTDAAVRDTLLDASSAGIPIVKGIFPATDISFFFPASSDTAIDYRYTILIFATGGSEALNGTYPNAANTNATLVTSGNELVMTIPVDISGSVSALNPDDINYRLRGRLVAKAPVPVQTGSMMWIATPGVTNGWHDALNWSPVGRPQALNPVEFREFGTTNGPGLVNSTVAANLTVSNVFFDVLGPDYHTIQINSGATLSVLAPDNTTSGPQDKFTLRPGSGTTATNAYVAVRGPGRLIVGDTNNPGIVDGMRVQLNSTNASSTVFGPHMGTMDLSQLNSFAFALGSLRVGASASGPGGNRGTMLLAKTNLIICGDPTNVITGGLLLGNGTVTAVQASESSGEMQLGHANNFRLFNLRVGGSRSLLGTMRFQSNLLANPTFRLRAINGTNAAGIFSIGDNFEAPNSATAYATGISTGRVDLVGGTVDCLVSNLFVGRNTKFTGTTSTRSLSGDGILTWTAGTMAVQNLSVGSQVANNAGHATGVVNVRSNATLLAGGLSLGRDAGTGAGTGNGTLNIVYGGQVTVTNNLVEDDGGAQSGTSRINLTNGTLRVGGTIVVDTLNVFSGVVSNTGICTISNRLMGAGTIRGAVTMAANSTLAPGNSIGTLTITSNLVMSATGTNLFEVDSGTLARDTVVGLSNVTYAGALVLSMSGTGLGLTNGASLKLFNAVNYGGAFANILPAIPTAGLVWDLSQMNVSGTLKIVSPVNTTPTNLTFAVIGNTVDIGWPASHTGWRLQAQTNSLEVGISNNWFTVAGSAATNHVILPVNPASGAVFYRLIYP